jgi:hypothetical protein
MHADGEPVGMVMSLLENVEAVLGKLDRRMSISSA